MKKLIWITSLTVLFVVFILPGFLALGIRTLPANVQPPLHGTKDVYGLFTVTQEFASLEPRLTGIGMSIKNPNLKNKKEVLVSLYAENGDTLRRVTLSGANIEDGGFVKFMFDPIPDSKDQKYILTIDCPSAGPEEVLPVYYTEETPSWVGKMTHDEKEVSGGLSMVTFHKPENKIKVIKEIYLNWFSRFLPLGFQKSD